jgi:F-type H+-transporting ATPase subunit b
MSWLWGVIVASSMLASPALASEEEHAHAAGGSLAPLVFSTINLAIFVWILARFTMPSVRNWVRDRHRQVVQALAEAAAAKAEAERLRSEWQARLAQIDQTIEEMRTRAREDVERERERILAAARKTAEAIRKDAERTAAYEVRRIQQQLRAELVQQAVRLAADTARTHWSPDDQDRFVADFLKQVSQ